MSGNLEVIVEIPGQPSGLGWLPDNSMLIISMIDQKLMKLKDKELSIEADLSKLVHFHCNDMVVAENGNAYIGNFGFNHEVEELKPTNLILVRPGEEPCIAAEDLFFPNGAIITPDNKTLIIGETWAARITAFDIEPDGSLSNRKVWAELSTIKEGYLPVLDGICLDEEGAVWMASPTTNEVIRIAEGAEVIETIKVDTNAYACMLGG